jgi:hypothetical protein
VDDFCSKIFKKKDMTKERLKSDIKRYFSTYTNFARIAQLDYYSFAKDFLNKDNPDKKYMDSLKVILAGLKDSDSNRPITPSELKLLKKAVMKRGGVIKLCREAVEGDGDAVEPLFSETSVYKILAGDDSYRKAARRLIEYLKL